MKELFEKKISYTHQDIAQIEFYLLKGLMGCRTNEAVEASKSDSIPRRDSESKGCVCVVRISPYLTFSGQIPFDGYCGRRRAL